MTQDLVQQFEQWTTEDLVSLLRNRNEDEWRPEVFEVVAAILSTRGVSPEQVAAMGPEPEDVTESAPTVTVASFPFPGQAHAFRMALEEAGLEAWVADDAMSTMYGPGIGARVQVRASDEAAALEILASPPAPTDGLPPELSEPACPECGGRNVAPEAWIDPDAPSEGWPRSRRHRKWYYVCADCNEAWPM